MTKAELVEQAAKDANVSKVAAAAALNSFMDGVTNALKKKDGKVTLVGFGTFSKVRRKARKGRNPQTGEPIKIKASNSVKFSPGKKTQKRRLKSAWLNRSIFWQVGFLPLLFSRFLSQPNLQNSGYWYRAIIECIISISDGSN